MYISTKTHELETNLAEWIQRCLAACCYVLGTVTISFARWAVLALELMILNDPPPTPYSILILTYVCMNHQKWLYIYLLKKQVVLLSICQFVTPISYQTRDWTHFGIGRWRCRRAMAAMLRSSAVLRSLVAVRRSSTLRQPLHRRPLSQRVPERLGREDLGFCGYFLYLTGCNHHESILHVWVFKVFKKPRHFFWKSLSFRTNGVPSDYVEPPWYCSRGTSGSSFKLLGNETVWYILIL